VTALHQSSRCGFEVTKNIVIPEASPGLVRASYPESTFHRRAEQIPDLRRFAALTELSW